MACLELSFTTGGFPAWPGRQTLCDDRGVEPSNLAQEISSLGGKVLRLNADGSIPGDNPFGNSRIYAMGLRNSFGMVFHPLTGHLWVTENGPDRNDEVNRIVAGGNYGWPIVTGIANDSRFLDPIWPSLLR